MHTLSAMSAKSKNKQIVVLGQEILPGKGYQLNFGVAKLHTSTSIQVPVIVERAKIDGPTVVLMAGVHGDEINGVEIIRRIIKQKINKPKKGTIICLPIFNIFGFLNIKRELPDGRDLNRSFPGSPSGSLASQFAYHFIKDIASVADYIIDYHTGAAQRNNYPQIRCVFGDEKSLNLAKIFAPPFILHSPYISKTIREQMHKLGKNILLFEGGKANSLEENVIVDGLEGTKRVLASLRMIPTSETSKGNESILLKTSKWMRAPISGLFQVYVQNGSKVAKGDILAMVTDPYGKVEKKIRATGAGYVFCVNEAPITYKGDAIFHIGK